MPSSTTLAPRLLARSIIFFRFERAIVTGSPRRPSFAPSSITTMAGARRSRSGAKRVRPPAVVSPLILALTTSTDGSVPCSSRLRRETQPELRAMPYSAERLSPTTRMRTGVADGESADSARPGASANRVINAAKPRR